MILSTIKRYIFPAVVAFAFISGVTVTHWYYKSKETSALKTAIKKANKTTEKDEGNIKKATENKENVRIVYKTIYKKVSHVKTTCTYPPGSEFVRLYNQASRGASTANAD